MVGLIYLLAPVILLTVALQLFRFLWSKKSAYYVSLKLPGPPALPFIGNGLSFIFTRKETLDIILQLSEPYPSPCRIWMGSKLFIFVKDPDNLHKILTSTKILKKDYIYSFLEPFFGKGLLTSYGQIHKHHRKLFQPMFNQKILEGYSYLFQKHALNFVKMIECNLNGAAFDVSHYLHESALASSMDIFLEDSSKHTFDYKEIAAGVSKVYDIFVERASKVWLRSNFLYKWTDLYREQKHLEELFPILIQEIEDAKISDLIKRVMARKRGEVLDETRPPSMLEMIIEMKINDQNCLSKKEIIHHLTTFILSGEDTQSSAVAFTLMMLGMHPEIQDKVVAELQNVLGNLKRPIDFLDLAQLKYMEMCIKEAMRLFPVVPFILRETENDFELDETITLPAGCTVFLSLFDVHKNAKYWEKPEEFYPEHFLPEAVEKRHPYAFLPFSAGPRKCIAYQYANINVKMIISTILQNYIIEADGQVSDIKIKCDLAIRPVDGHLIRIKKRVT